MIEYQIVREDPGDDRALSQKPNHQLPSVSADPETEMISKTKEFQGEYGAVDQQAE